MDLLLQQLAWLMGQPETWFALARHAASLLLMVMLARWLWSRRNWAALGLFLAACAGLLASYVWAFEIIRQAFMSGVVEGTARTASVYLASVHVLQAVALVAVIVLGVWVLIRRRAASA